LTSPGKRSMERLTDGAMDVHLCRHMMFA